jgi:hypothetical protein
MEGFRHQFQVKELSLNPEVDVLLNNYDELLRPLD